MIVIEVSFGVSRDSLIGAALCAIGDRKQPRKVERPGIVLDIVREYIRLNGCTEKPNCPGSDILEREYVNWGDDMAGNRMFKKRLAKAEALVDQWWPALKGAKK